MRHRNFKYSCLFKIYLCIGQLETSLIISNNPCICFTLNVNSRKINSKGVNLSYCHLLSHIVPMKVTFICLYVFCGKLKIVLIGGYYTIVSTIRHSMIIRSPKVQNSLMINVIIVCCWNGGSNCLSVQKDPIRFIFIILCIVSKYYLLHK